MATVTPNFNWPVPTSTDLVKDGATAIEALGDSIDASLVDLKGGTTGQVLAKATNTDMDFAWVAQDDSNAIQNSIVDAKGDLIAASANDTPARLAVGNNGETIVADSSTSTGLVYQANWAAGKNKIINGDFRINQRNFTSVADGSYTFDRWKVTANAGPNTVTPQTFTPGAAPVAGYEGSTFAQIVTTGQSGGAYCHYVQPIEDVRTFANQNIVISFWAKASSGTPTIAAGVIQNFGSGGSSQVETNTTGQAISTSWARYSFKVTVPSISGKTIGTSSYLTTQVILSNSGISLNNNTFQIWGVQAEAGTVATAFQTATGTIQGELAACQRYCNQNTMDTTTTGEVVVAIGNQVGAANTAANYCYPYPVQMRVKPTITMTGMNSGDQAGFTTAATINSTRAGLQTALISTTHAANGAVYRPIFLQFPNLYTTAYVRFEAEL